MPIFAAVFRKCKDFMFRKAKIFFLSLLLLIPAQSLARRYTVMVSLDGFRDSYARAYRTPFLDSLARMGVSATMQPSFPSKTFPNHYTLVTGLAPDHHGIIANSFYDLESGLTFSLGDKRTKQDPRFWGGEPVWNTAAKQGKKVGVVYWPGSDVKIQGRYPDYYHDYEQKPLLSFAERVAEVGRYLRLPENDRPELVLAYFEEPDHSGHVYGPWSKEARHAVERVDKILEELYSTFQTLPERDSINFIVLADHGMTDIDDDHLVDPFLYINKEWVERIQYDCPTHIWPKKGCEEKILKGLASMPHVRIWRKNEVPGYLHYGTNPNIGPVLVCPDMGWTVGNKHLRMHGTHGFDPTGQDMQVIFRAAGPDFKRGWHKERAFSNTSIYPLLCHLLRIEGARCDGDIGGVEEMLEKEY